MEKMMIGEDKPEITAYDGDTDKFRLVRLNRTLGYAYALADHYGNKDFLDKIIGLHDHKGTLTVKWNKEPTAGEKELFSKAWESRVGDGADNVEHEVTENR